MKRRAWLACFAGACALGSAAAADAARARALLAAGEFGAAVAALSDERDPLARQDVLAQVYLEGAEPARALSAAEAGLKLAPAHLDLLYRATASALWLGLGERARAHAAALGGAVAADRTLSDDERTAWLEASADLSARAATAAQDERRRDALAGRARSVSLTLLAGLALLLGALLVVPARADRVAPHGTPDR